MWEGPLRLPAPRRRQLPQWSPCSWSAPSRWRRASPCRFLEKGQVSLFETLLSGSFLNPGVPKFLVLGSFLIYHVLFLHLLHSQPSSVRCRPILVRSFVLPSTFSCAPRFVRLLFPFWLISACLPRWRVPSNFC